MAAGLFQRNRLVPTSELTEAQREYGLKYVLRDGMASQAMASLTGSGILVAFALKLGASNTLIGLLAAIPQLAQLSQLPAVGIVNRVRNRRLIAVVSSLLGRLSWVAIALAPFFLSRQGVLTTLVAGMLISSLLAAIANCGWNSWMHDLVPTPNLASFFGHRLSLATSTGVVVSLAAGLFIDHLSVGWFTDDIFAYSTVFLVAFGFGILGVIFVGHIPEPVFEPSPESVFDTIRRPFADQNFRRLMHFLAVWNFAVYLATPFFSVYMLTRLGMSLTWVIGLTVLGRIVNIVFLRLWGSFADYISLKSVLAVSAPLFLVCILGWTFTTFPETHFLTLPLLVVLHIVMGIAMAGITLALGSIGLKLAPKDEGISYLAATNFVSALAAGLAPILSGRMVDFFVDRKLEWTISYTSPRGVSTIELINFQQWDFLFFLSIVVGLYGIHRLSLVVEEGEIGEKAVVVELVSALGREVRDLSTVASIRNVLSMIPFHSDALHRRRREAPKNPPEPLSGDAE